LSVTYYVTQSALRRNDLRPTAEMSIFFISLVLILTSEKCHGDFSEIISLTELKARQYGCFYPVSERNTQNVKNFV